MAIVIPEGFAQVIYEFTRNGDPDPYNVILGTSVPTGGTLLTVAGSFLDAFDENLDGQMTTVQRLTRVTVLTATEGAELGANVVGAVIQPALPQNVAVLVQKRSGLRGRANQGRNYWPGFIAEQGVNEVGVISANDVNGLQNAFNAWHADLTADNHNLVILHDDTSPVQTPTLVTELVVDSTVATQRRRLR